MEALGSILVIVGLATFIFGVVNVIRPIKRLKIPTRLFAMGVIGAGVVAFSAGSALLPRTSNTSPSFASNTADSQTPTPTTTSTALPTPTATLPVAKRNATQDQLLTLTNSNRACVLGSFIPGGSGPGVTGAPGCNASDAFFMGMGKDSSAYWSIRCANTKAYEIVIAADDAGSVRVVDCSTFTDVGRVPSILQSVQPFPCFAKISQ